MLYAGVWENIYIQLIRRIWPHGAWDLAKRSKEGWKFLCLVLASEAHGQLGKEDGCEAQREKTSGWRRSRCLPSHSSMGIWPRRQGSCSGRRIWLGPHCCPGQHRGLQSSNKHVVTTPTFQELKNKPRKQDSHSSTSTFPILYQMSLEAHTDL